MVNRQKILARLRLALSHFRLFGRQLWLLLLGFWLGFSALYCLFFMIEAFRTETARRFPTRGRNLFSIIKEEAAGVPAPAQTRPLDLEILHVLQQSDFITDLSPELRDQQLLRHQGQEIEISVIGVLPGYRRVHGLQLREGRFINDLDKNCRTCVLGAQLHQLLHRPSVGDCLYAGNQVYEIAGILHPTTGMAGEFDINAGLFVHVAYLQQFLLHPEIRKVTLRPSAAIESQRIKPALEKVLQRLVGDIRGYEISNQQLYLRRIFYRINGLSIFLGTLGATFLLAAAWTFLRLMTATMLDRWGFIQVVSTPEQYRRNAFLQFGLETVLLILAGILGGLLSSLTFTAIISRMTGWPFAFSWRGMAIVIVLGPATAFVCFWYPFQRIFGYSRALSSSMGGTK
ncbi:ABC transporter permease [candidate division KSB1 bacterium]|nr:ABC transporter permease [candidate division KSB1 bacterium]